MRRGNSKPMENVVSQANHSLPSAEQAGIYGPGLAKLFMGRHLAALLLECRLPPKNCDSLGQSGCSIYTEVMAARCDPDSLDARVCDIHLCTFSGLFPCFVPVYLTWLHWLSRLSISPPAPAPRKCSLGL